MPSLPGQGLPLLSLNDGRQIPGLAFGTGSRWRTKNVNDGSIDSLLVQALKDAVAAGFRSIDGSECYYNESSLGKALAECGIPREELYLKTKILTSARDVPASIAQQLDRLGVTYLDAYLIHSPTIFSGDLKIIDVWREMEKLVDQGIVRSIGVSNFEVEHFEQFYDDARIKPAINQIAVYPYCLGEIEKTIKYCEAKGVLVEGYAVSSSLIRPSEKGGPLDDVLYRIAGELEAAGHKPTFGQILFRWASRHGFAVVSTTANSDRMREYLHSGDIELSDEQVLAIDTAGLQGAAREHGKYTPWSGVSIKI